MSIDKSLSPAPLGLPKPNGKAPPPDFEVEIDLDGDNDADTEDSPDDVEEDKFNENLAETLDEKELRSLVSDLLSDFETDVNSRREWMQTYVDGLELLGLKIDERSEPWEGACGVNHPLLSEAVVKFQAETIMETFPAQGPVRTLIIGKETQDKVDAAKRVEADMNFQLTERMTEYRPEHERMLWGLGLAGNAFKKVYYDPSLGRQTAVFIPVEDVVVPYGASSLETAERCTHIMRKTENELKRLQASGFYIDEDLGEPVLAPDEVEKKIAEQTGFDSTSDNRFKLLEMHVNVIIDADKEAEGDLAHPYVITIEKGTETVLAIRRNWHKDDRLHLKRNHFVHYPYVPGFGFYAFGLIHLVGGFAKSGTSLIRQLVDAGTLSNLPGGFKTKGLRVKGDDTPIGPGEFRDVDVASGTMRDNIMPLPYKEPSQVLMALLEGIVEEGRRFAGAADLQISDMSAQAPVGTTLAILERTLKMMSAVQARVHYAMKRELQLLRDIIRDYTPDHYSYEPEDGVASVKKADYDLVEVIPVSDPNASTMAQKIVQYQAVMQLAQTAPGIYNMPVLHRQMLDVLGIKDADKLVPTDDDQKPLDPVSENMDILNKKPVKAFMYQDHAAHITVHMSAAQDPKIQQMISQSPDAPMIQSALAAHVTEHIAFEYRQRIEDAAGVPYPEPDAPMSQDVEVQVSRLAAAAAQKVLGQAQSQQQAQQAQQTAQDPIVQMQQQELELKKGELALKAKKMAIDAAAKQDQIDTENKRIESQAQVAGLNVGAQLALGKAQLTAKEKVDGLNLGLDVVKQMQDLDAHGDKMDLGHKTVDTQAETQRAAQAAQQEESSEGE